MLYNGTRTRLSLYLDLYSLPAPVDAAVVGNVGMESEEMLTTMLAVHAIPWGL